MLGEHEALFSNRKIREMLGFVEEDNWRKYVKDLGLYFGAPPRAAPTRISSMLPVLTPVRFVTLTLITTAASRVGVKPPLIYRWQEPVGAKVL